MSTGKFQHDLPLIRIKRRVTHPSPSCLFNCIGFARLSFLPIKYKKKVILSTRSEILALLKPVADIPLTSEGPRFQ